MHSSKLAFTFINLNAHVLICLMMKHRTRRNACGHYNRFEIILCCQNHNYELVINENNKLSLINLKLK